MSTFKMCIFYYGTFQFTCAEYKIHALLSLKTALWHKCKYNTNIVYEDIESNLSKPALWLAVEVYNKNIMHMKHEFISNPQNTQIDTLVYLIWPHWSNRICTSLLYWSHIMHKYVVATT